MRVREPIGQQDRCAAHDADKRTRILQNLGLARSANGGYPSTMAWEDELNPDWIHELPFFLTATLAYGAVLTVNPTLRWGSGKSAAEQSVPIEFVAALPPAPPPAVALAPAAGRREGQGRADAAERPRRARAGKGQGGRAGRAAQAASPAPPSPSPRP